MRLFRSLASRLKATPIARRFTNPNSNSSASKVNTSNPLKASASALLVAAPLAMAAAATYSASVTKVPAEPGTVPDDAAERAHHVVSSKGETTGFHNPHPSFGPGMTPTAILSRILRAARHGERVGSPDIKTADLSVQDPTFLPTRHSSSKLRATWLGHACYYVEFPSGLRALFDPVFEDRCSPFTFMGPRRYTPAPCAPADIPIVDAVIISHSHYDHLSSASVAALARRHPAAHFFVGLGLAKWFRSAGIDKVTELDWWQDADLSLAPPSAAAATASSAGDDNDNEHEKSQQPITARISCLPCQHSSGRTGIDRDTTLWCSWGVRSGGRSVWFGGDTGYRAVPFVPPPGDDWGPDYDALPVCPQFAQIGKFRGPFDLGLIPIGAYAPRSVWSPMHANPYDAVEIFRDTRCSRAMGIHWGTWALTSEDVMEPPVTLKEALKRRGLPETGLFDTCHAGESREF